MQTQKSPSTESTPPAEAGASRSANGAAAWALGVAAVVFGVGLCVNTCPAFDLFWQLRAGHDILTTHAIPHANTYSYVRPGAPWVAHEWLTFALFAMAFAKCGFAGVWLIEAGMVGVLSAILYMSALRGMRAPVPALALTLVAELASAPLFQPRPHLATYVGVAIVCAVAWSARGGDAKRIYWLVPLFAVWANLHAGVIVGVGIVGLIGLCDGVEDVVGRRLNINRPLPNPLLRAGEGTSAGAGAYVHFLAAAVLGALATLLTPYSWHVYQNVGATLGNGIAMDNVAEWKSPNFHDFTGHLIETYLWVVVLSLLLSRERRSLADVLLVAFFAHESLTAIRNAPLLAIVGVSVAAPHLQSILAAALRPKGEEKSDDSIFLAARPPAMIAAMLCVLVVAVCGMRAKQVVASAPGYGSGLTRVATACFGVASFPAAACRFIERESFSPFMRMYNSYDDGGFLILRLPEFPVFADGRADIYFGKPLDRIQAMTTLPYDWSSKLAPENPDFAILGVDQQQARLFLQSPAWALVYADRPDLDAPLKDVADTLIFVRRDPAYRELIMHCRSDCPAVAQVRASYPGYEAAW